MGARGAAGAGWARGRTGWPEQDALLGSAAGIRSVAVTTDLPAEKTEFPPVTVLCRLSELLENGFLSFAVVV